MSTVIGLNYATVIWETDGVRVVFHDGAWTEGHPHHIPHYYVIAHRCGYGDDILSYCREHEFIHEFLSEHLTGGPSRVLWRLAHKDRPLTGSESAWEELGVQAFQRWLRANERPIVAGVDWDKLKAEALALLDR